MKRMNPAVALLLAFASLFLPAIGRTQESLFPGVAYPAGSGSYSATVADVNGDGRPDIIVANYNANTVSVLLNTGNGIFAAKTDYTVGSGPYSVTVADVNGDGKPDIVTANYTGNTISVLLNNGNGTFAAETDWVVGLDPSSVAVADVDGDGKLDIVTANNHDQTISVLLGNGNGTFASRIDYAVGYSPASVAVADINGDGKADIVTANYGIYNSFTGVYSGSSISVLLNVAERSRVSGLLTLEGISPSAPAQPVTFTYRTPGFDDFAPTTNVLPSGNFAVNLPKRSGTLHIKGQKYLAKNVNVDAMAGDVSGVMATLSAGDANNDNSVDIADFGVLVGAFGSSVADPTSGYIPNADFNGDGMVDIVDFGLLVNNYGEAGDP